MMKDYSLFDTLLEPVFVLNAQQEILYCNETAALMAGMSVRKLTRGLRFSEVFAFDTQVEVFNALTTVTDPTPYKELSFKNSQGDEGKVQLTLQPFAHTPERQEWIIFFRDVTLEERLQKKYRAELGQKEDVIAALEQAKVQLEDYSKNLEVMVADRTADLSRLNQTLSALLDSLGQGFFIFDAQGKILEVTSKACESILECQPGGKQIWEVLKVPENKIDGFQKWMTTVFQEMLPFEDLAPLGPVAFEHSKNRKVALEYHPLRDANQQILGVVVVASDITSLVEAKATAEQEKEHAKLIINMIKSKREIQRFITESESMIVDLCEEISNDSPDFDKELIFRHLHTLKGGSAIFSVRPLADSCHRGEEILSELRENWSLPGHIALRGQIFEIRQHFENFLTETQSILGKQAIQDERQVEVAISKLNSIAKKLGQLPGGGPMAQELLLDLAMEPIDNFLHPYAESLPVLAHKLGKSLGPVLFETQGLGVMPEIYSPLFSTLIHAFRNSLDHGLEYPEERELFGKAPEGALTVLTALQQTIQGPWLHIEIKDDGRGIDPEVLRQKLAEKGVDTSSESDADVIQHIFDSQFSTREEVTELSGRGVGMEAVRIAAEALKGHVWVESKLSQGTSIHIEVPYITEFKAQDSKKSQRQAA